MEVKFVKSINSSVSIPGFKYMCVQIACGVGVDGEGRGLENLRGKNNNL